MKTYTDDSRRTLLRLNQSIYIGLLSLHFYKECYWLFHRWHLSSAITDKVFSHIQDTRLLEPFTAKGLAFLFLVLSVCLTPVRKQRDVSWRTCCWQAGLGVFLYFASLTIFGRDGSLTTTCLSYLALSLVGIALLHRGLSGFLSLLPLSLTLKDPFGRQKGGFPQEQRLLNTPFSMHLPARYRYQGEEKDSWVNLINPRRGILILGSPGSGKSWFIIEPLIRQWMEKGNVLFLYDFKYDKLTRLVYHYFELYRQKFPAGTAFYSINFSDLSRSHRCNVLDPASLDWVSDALGVSRTILLSINKTWIDKQGEFFVESPINFIGALIWYLRRYKDGLYCTLPHVIELAQQPYQELFAILERDPEVHSLIHPFVQAFQNETFDMLDGQLSSAKIPLSRLASPDLYYILTGDDLTLDINNPASPKIFCLGGHPVRQEALAPVLSLYIDRLNKLCNREGRKPCALFCDEFATVRAYSMSGTIATARSHDIVPVIAVQDLSQLRMQYTRDEADLFLNATGNLLCGQVGGETARWISERFPRIEREKESVSVSEETLSVSTSRQWEPTITPATIATLSSGEFVGVVTDDPDKEMELKAFHAKLVREGEPVIPEEVVLPMVRQVNREAVERHFKLIREDVENIVATEMMKVAEQIY